MTTNAIIANFIYPLHPPPTVTPTPQRRTLADLQPGAWPGVNFPAAFHFTVGLQIQASRSIHNGPLQATEKPRRAQLHLLALGGERAAGSGTLHSRTPVSPV